MFASVFLLLYVAHLLADYPLQTDHQAGHKAACGVAGWRANLAHAATHVAVCSLALAVAAVVLDEGIGVLPGAAAVVLIGVTHAVIDRRWPVEAWMRIARQRKWAAAGGAAHVDQTAHVLVLAVAALALTALS
ncbi:MULTISPECIES: DUF3307 domain-containing protein [unclassified Streptomyces]|uniref:DUF3307 domain-containing protein n=1 Tax=unclassified Streptomyces TaxID=2593676 RepID=UPI000365CB4E|nr:MULTISPECIES: DUF3307 domain-containing protein [unclassified Streptomyces]MYS39144.1 DUF3307 domain-containing protein [Streptomyces sp. SID4920]MYX64149.1 DUF3307 domain-containing protein [Streptomyces sp. SID8373]